MLQAEVYAPCCMQRDSRRQIHQTRPHLRPAHADVRKQANRVNFNQVEEEFLDGDETVGLGVLGSKGQVCSSLDQVMLPA